MNNQIQNIDWSDTPLGPIEKWPQALYSFVNICYSSNAPAFICWEDELIFVSNDKWSDLMETESGSLLGKPAREVLARDWSFFKTNFREVLSTGEVREVENKLLSLASEEQQQCCAFSFNPIVDGKGIARGVFTIARKIISDTHNENELPQSEHELADSFENAPIGIHWLSPDGTILKVNQAELDMLGYSREEFVGRNIAEFYVDQKLIKSALQQLERGEDVHNCEGQMIRKDGSIREILLSSNVYRKNGKFIHTRCFTRDVTDDKRWQRMLQESENRYRTLVDNFPKGAVGLFDKDLRYETMGGKLLSEVGIKEEDRIGNKISDIYPEKMVDEFIPNFRAVFEGKSNSFDVEFHDRHLLGHTLPIRNDQGEIISGMLVVQDITERWQAQQKLRESEAKFRMMAENLNDIIWMVSEDGEEFIYINPAFEKVWGIDRKKLYDETLSFLDYVHPEDRDRIEKRYTSSQGEFDDTYRIIRPDGEVRWLHSRGSKVYDEDTQITRIIGIAEDITKRKHAEQQLRKSRNRLKAALDIETVGVIFWSGEDLTIKETNDAFLKMSGFSHEEILGKSWRDLTPEEFHKVSEKAISDVKNTGHAEPYEKQYLRKDGTRWWGLFAPRTTDKNEAVEFVLDITDRKEAQKKLEHMNETLEERVKERTKKLRSYQRQLRSLASQLNKAEEQERQRLASELHGSLGQMLAVAKMKTDGLQHGNIPEMLSGEIEELKQVIEEALTYNQNLMLELMPPPMLDKEDVTEVIVWTAKQVEKQGLTIDINDDGQPKPVDKKLRTILYQSVRELLQNVLKHTEASEVRITMFVEQGEVKIIVEDNGKGFDVRDEARPSTEHGGFGLFNIKERMDWHGGSFEIESVPGTGTKATLCAPLNEKEPQPAEAEILPPPPKETLQDELQQKIKVLLVDDHKMMRRGLRQLIEKQDDLLLAEEASNGKEALELARATAPHIIIMDVNMPLMDGIEATQKIKAEMPEIRVIGLSLHESPEVIEGMRSAGASDYLTKKEAFESLIATIRAEISASEDKKGNL